MLAGTSHAEQTDVGAGVVVSIAGAPRPRGLPVSLSSFVGRASELAELRRALTNTRLLTLTGPGGCGKTRLALQLAVELLALFMGAVAWVELAPLLDERLIGTALADAFDVRPLPGVTELQAACAVLALGRALVIFDNCEHVLSGCAVAVGRLLKAAPGVVVLATSRAPLGVEGETVWRVPPLSLPGAGGSSGPPAGSDAVSLFVERARQARPGFALSAGNADSVSRVCAGADGLPLAIELAAARLRMLSVEQIATGLASRFRLLTGGPRTATARQQTLRASVEWSHDLLAVDERALLRRLSVFAGGFTHPAAEQVCRGDGIEPEQVLDLLASLVDQSIVIAAEQGTVMRYRLLETMREFALERLTEAGEEEAVRARHREAFLVLAEQAGPQLETACQGEWLERLDSDGANLVAAFEDSLRTDVSQALRFCVALYRWWGVRGRFAEAEDAHSRSLDACGRGEPALRARVMHGRAYLAVWAGDFVAAEAHATNALALAAEAGDLATAARARCQLGAALHFADPRAGRAEFARAADLARRASDDWALGTATWLTVSSYMWQSDHARAARANQEAAALAERLGDPFQIARGWLYVTWMACFDGRFTEAREAAGRLGAVVGATGEPIMEALAGHFVAFADILQGDPERALERQQASLERALTLGAGSVVPWLIFDIAYAELALGRPERAADRLEHMVALVEGRIAFGTCWALCFLAEAQRLLGDGTCDATALRAQASGEQIGNRLTATFARLSRGRLAAARGDWPVARQHALAHLDACVEGGHTTYLPGCLDALAEIAAGLHRHADAARLFGAAERVRAEIGTIRIPSEDQHWAAIELRLRGALGDGSYVAARTEGAQLSIDDACEWARRTRGPRGRPPGGWGSLTPTEARVATLVAEGLSNRQIGERMFISPETVKTHLGHIFNKIDAHSRAELAAQAARHEPTN